MARDLKVEEFACGNCGAEFTVTYDQAEVLDEAIYCPFCGGEIETDDQAELDFD